MSDEAYPEKEPTRAAPATGSSDPAETQLAREEEPDTTGTLFLTIILLMIIAAFWAIIYVRLLDR